MRPRWIRKVVVGMALSSILGTHAFAQSSGMEEGKRKVKTKVAPAYPELAKRMNVVGKVKIEVIITPDGRVKSTRAGHVACCAEHSRRRSGHRDRRLK